MARALAELEALSVRFAAQEFHLAKLKADIAEVAAGVRMSPSQPVTAQAAFQTDLAGFARSFDSVEAHLVRLAASHARKGPLQRRWAALGRIFRRPADLSPHVAAPYEPLIEHSVLSPWFTRRHRLILAEPLRPGELVAYEASIGQAAISRVLMAGALARTRGGLLPATLDLYDARANRVLAAGSIVAAHVAGSAALTATIPSVSVGEGARCYVRLAGGPDIDAWGLRLYEWRAYGRLLGRTAHCGLFGAVS